jgi:hypothetical protein
MPFVASVEGRFGYGTPGGALAGDIKTSGNGVANLSTTGMTSLTGVAGQDDAAAQMTIPFDFFYFGSNYGNNLNGGFWWCTNNVFVFGASNATISWAANTGRGILIGNTDRRTNTLHYTSTIQTSSGYNYMNFVLNAQNIYNDGVPNAIRWQMRLFRSPTRQYVEVRANTAPATGGAWNITNGTTFQNTYGAFTNVTAGSSFVLQSDGNGSNWQFFNNYRIPI